MPTELHPSYPVRTDRLLLRPLTMADVDALVAYRSIPDLCRYVPFPPQSRADVEARITGVFANHALTGEGQNLTLGVEVAETGELVGDVILMYHSHLHAGGEVGWILNPRYGGHGYATEAAREMLRLGFEELGLRRIVARIDERNTASARLAHRLGMRQEARLVENEFFKGEWTTELDFAMLATEWFASHATAGATPPPG
jgi:RimJ/RimL family protein N-acetyltransferase